MKKTPLVSVLMPVYNVVPFLAEAIESILNQSYRHFEFIIIDDASTDSSWEIIQKYAKKDDRVVALRNEKNMKICKTLNKGLRYAHGKYIARFDSDDLCTPERLQKQVDFMEKEGNAEVGVCGSNFFLIDKKGRRTGRKDFPESDEACRKNIFLFNPFGHNTVLIRKACFDAMGDYNPGLTYAEDLDLWFRFGRKYRFHNLQEYLVSYRLFDDNSIFRKQKEMIRNTLKVRKKALKEGGYKMGFRGCLASLFTRLMLTFPSKTVFRLFNVIRRAFHLKPHKREGSF